MELNALHRHSINWNGVRATATQLAQAAHDIERTYPAIMSALRQLQDSGQSTYRTTGNATLSTGRPPCGDLPAAAVDAPAGIGYVKPGTFFWTREVSAYVDDIQDQVRQRGDSATGWIVDLRFADGDTQWPLLAGLGPLIGGGVQGHIVDSDGVEKSWEYVSGTAFLGGVAMASATAPYDLRQPGPRIAVLINGATSNAAESAAIAFKGRPGTRFFGTPTCGLTKAIGRFRLSDGGDLLLAIGIQTDRARRAYETRVDPDEFTIDPSEVVTRAIAWLRSGS